MLPVLLGFFFPLLFVGLLAGLYARFRHAALLWAASGVGGLLFWGTFMLFRPAATLTLYRWVPWFPRAWATTWNLMGRWDVTAWSLALVLAAWSTAALLALGSTGQATTQPWTTWLAWWLALVPGLWFLLPATPAALWWAWAAADLATLLLALGLTRPGEARLVWLWNTTARAPTWVVALLWASMAGYRPLEATDLPANWVFWLYLAGLWRTLWLGPARGLRRQGFVQHVAPFWLAWWGAGSTLVLFPALARAPRPEGGLFWVLVLAALGAMVVGLARWMAANRPEAGLNGWLTLAGGMMALAALAGAPEGARFWAGWPWFLVAGLSFFVATDPALRAAGLPFLVVYAFLPYTPGRDALAWLQLLPWPVRGAALLLLTPAMLSSLPWHWFRKPAQALQPRWSRIGYLAGMGVLVLGLWRWTWPGMLEQPEGLWPWAAGPVLWLAAAALAFLVWKRRQTLEVRWRVWQWAWRYLRSSLVAFYRNAIQLVEESLYFLSLVFEGKSSLMWALALLMALVLFLSRGN